MQKTSLEHPRATRVTIPIYGFVCTGAEAALAQRALSRVPGVFHSYVSPATEMAYVIYDPARACAEDLADAVHRAGLRAGPPTVH
jgi:hypothetical protein